MPAVEGQYTAGIYRYRGGAIQTRNLYKGAITCSGAEMCRTAENCTIKLHAALPQAAMI